MLLGGGHQPPSFLHHLVIIRQVLVVLADTHSPSSITSAVALLLIDAQTVRCSLLVCLLEEAASEDGDWPDRD